MKVNENTVKGKWLEIRGDLQKAWGKLTDNELDKTKGDFKAIGGLIQQRYGESQEKSKEKLTGILNRIEQNKNSAVKSVKKQLKA